MVRNLPSRAVLVAFLFVSVGCRETQAEKQQTSALDAVAPCVPSEALSFQDPQSAYRKYADSINSREWCEAIGTFEREQRIDLVVATFKGLVLMAGLQSPNRSEYFEVLRAFCVKHGLDYASDSRVASLTASILSKSSIDNELAPVRQLARHAPETIYAELMTSVAHVNGPAMTKFDPQIVDLTLDGDSARGFAVRNDGQRIPVSFVKAQAGWLLAEP